MKQCNHCKEIKSDEEFAWRYKRLGIRSPTCRSCKAGFDQRYYQGRSEEHSKKVWEQKKSRREVAREFVWSYLAKHPCIECGEADPILLEFDHIKGKKKYNVSQMVGQGFSLKAIQAEIDKCQVLCVACHRRKTYEDNNWFRG
jgi:5-methylcytosine-specific restriction endonuclease McrA